MARQSNVILHCIPTVEGGGTERQLVYLSEVMVRCGWNVHIALLRPGINFEPLIRTGAKIHKILHKSNYDPRISGFLISLIKGIYPRSVFTWLHNMDFFCGVASTLLRI